MFEKCAIELALTKNPPVAPKYFLWYVNDSHAQFKNLQSANKFKTILNNQDPNIQYTIVYGLCANLCFSSTRVGFGIWLVFLVILKYALRDSTGKMKVDERRFDEKVWEALEIQLQASPHSENGLNQDNGQYVTTRFWKPMFFLRRQHINVRHPPLTSIAIMLSSNCNLYFLSEVDLH